MSLKHEPETVSRKGQRLRSFTTPLKTGGSGVERAVLSFRNA
jgi:hypothetical protein